MTTTTMHLRTVTSICLGSLLTFATTSTAFAQLWGPDDLEVAIAAAPDGGVIDLPAGTFDFTSNWNPPNPITKKLTFRGTGHTVILGDPAQRFLRSSDDLFLEGIELRDFKIGVKLSPDAGQTMKASFDNVRFLDIDTGILADGSQNHDTGLESLVVRNCVFTDGIHGIDIELPTYRNVSIEGNLFEDFSDRGITMGTTLYDPDEKRAQIFMQGNTVRRVGDGATTQPIGIIIHGNHCFLNNNFVEDVNAGGLGGEAAGLYTKCKYSKVLGNTVVNSAASTSAAGFNGAITIKGKERSETNGPQGYGAMVANNHIVYTDLTLPKRVAVKIHADWVNVSDNIIEEASDATVISLPTILHNVTVDGEVLWQP